MIFDTAMLRYLLFMPLWLLLSGALALADDPSFTVSAPQRVAEGERFRVTWTLDARPDDFQAPSFNGFRRISGPSTSSSTSTQIINNQVTTTVSYSYTFVLEAAEEGTFTIPPARAVIDGREHASESASVEVTDGPATSAQPSQPRQEERGDTRPGPDDIFIRAEVSNSSPFQGEQIIISYKLYTRLSVQNYNIERLPAFQGMWTENITPSGQPSVTRELIGEDIYNVAEIRRMAVFPQRSGEISIEPMEVEMAVRIRAADSRRPGSPFDDFFGGSPFSRYQTITHRERSEPVILQVERLPAEGRPEDFTGLVGNFELRADLSPENIDVNDAASLSVTLSGEGNLRMAELPEVSFPRHLDIFDPQVTDDIRVSSSGIKGSRQFEYVIIARSTGDFEIPALNLSYFDPGSRTYRTPEAGPFSLRVHGELLTGSDAPGRRSGRWQTEDIRYIHTGSVNWQSAGDLFYKSTRFFLLAALPLILLIVFLIIWKKHMQSNADIQGIRIKRARNAAIKRLKHAERMLRDNQREAFFEEIFKALWGYVSDRLEIPVSRLNKENVASAFASRHIPSDLADRFLEGLYECEYARFAPMGEERPMDITYEKALDTIVTLEKELRKNNTKR